MILRTLMILASFAMIPAINADTVYRIEVGEDYANYSNRDLRRRVWQLERAVAQLQQKVFELQVNGVGTPTATPAPKWSCYIQALSKTFTATRSTESAAKAEVIQQCSSEYGNIHCKDKDVKCGN